MLYVLNNLTSWRGEEARAAKAVLRAVSKGDLPAKIVGITQAGMDYWDEDPRRRTTQRRDLIRSGSTDKERELWLLGMMYGAVPEDTDELPPEFNRRYGRLVDSLIAKGYLREFPKGAGPSHFTAAEEYVRHQTELQERDIHAATHHNQGEGQFDVYHPGVGPGHYTDETPEGALEAMERRLQEVLATMDLRVGELAEAIQQMGATGIPVPVVEAIEDAVQAITIAAEEATEATEAVGFILPRQGTKARMIADHLLQLGADAGTTDMATFLEGIRAANPGTSFNDMDYYGIVRRFPLLPRLSLLGRGHRRGVGGPQEPAAPPVDITERRTPTGRIPRARKPWREESTRSGAITAYMLEQGAKLSTMDSDEIAAAVQERWPGTTDRQVTSAYNNATNRGTKLPKLKRRALGRTPGTPQPPRPAPVVETPPPPPVGRPGTPTTTEEIESLEERTAAIYMDGLGDDLTGKTAEEIRADLIYQWPDITLAQVRNGWNSLRWIRHAQGQPRPPMLRASDAPGTIEGLLGGAGDLRPERQIRNGGSWSRKYYPGLPEWEHDANDAWFESALNLLKPDGIIGIPNLQRAFNKQGEEIPWPGESEIRPPNRVMMNPPTSMRASWY